MDEKISSKSVKELCEFVCLDIMEFPRIYKHFEERIELLEKRIECIEKEKEKVQKKPSSIQRERVGESWSDYEESALIQEIDKCIGWIAEKHERNIGGITARIKLLQNKRKNGFFTI